MKNLQFHERKMLAQQSQDLKSIGLGSKIEVGSTHISKLSKLKIAGISLSIAGVIGTSAILSGNFNSNSTLGKTMLTSASINTVSSNISEDMLLADKNVVEFLDKTNTVTDSLDKNVSREEHLKEVSKNTIEIIKGIKFGDNGVGVFANIGNGYIVFPDKVKTSGEKFTEEEIKTYLKAKGEVFEKVIITKFPNTIIKAIEMSDSENESNDVLAIIKKSMIIRDGKVIISKEKVGSDYEAIKSVIDELSSISNNKIQ